MSDTIRGESARLADTVQSWVRRTPPNQLAQEEYQEAIRLLDMALERTMVYLRDPNSKDDKETPKAISKMWRQASQAIAPLDPELANACGMKGFGWIDPDTWERARKNGVKIGIEEMQDALMALTGKRPSIAAPPPPLPLPTPTVPSWFPIAGFVFAVGTVLFLMTYLVVGPQIDAQKKIVFDVLIALCVAGSGTFLGGAAVANGKIPFFKDSPIQFSLAGGVAIFVIVLLLMHKMT